MQGLPQKMPELLETGTGEEEIQTTGWQLVQPGEQRRSFLRNCTSAETRKTSQEGEGGQS